MKRVLKIVSLLVLVSYTVSNAQKKKPAKPEPAVPAFVKPKKVFTFLGDSEYQHGGVPKKTFDELIRKGLTSKDSAGTSYKVYSFSFSYSERQLYEDSVGNLIWMNDFFSEACMGDTLTTVARLSLIDGNRTKPGDTAYFDAIKVLMPDGSAMGAKSMKFYLTK